MRLNGEPMMSHRLKFRALKFRLNCQSVDRQITTYNDKQKNYFKTVHLNVKRESLKLNHN